MAPSNAQRRIHDEPYRCRAFSKTHPAEPSQKRIQWIDALKGIAIISVIIGHALLGFLQKDTYPSAANAFQMAKDWIYTWHMPLFFILSGIAFRLSCLRGETLSIQKVRRSTLNLLILYLIFESLLPVLKIIFSAFVNNAVHPSELIWMILLPTTPMWYLWVLIIYEWAFAFVFYQKPDLRLLFAVLIIISLTGNWLQETELLPRLCLRQFLKCGVFFGAGLYWKEIKALLLRTPIILLSGVIAAAGLIYMVCTYLLTPYQNLWINVLWLKGLNAAAICLLFILAFEKISALGNNRFLVSVGRHSFVIFLLHTYFVTAMRVVVAKAGLQNPIAGLLAASVIPVCHQLRGRPGNSQNPDCARPVPTHPFC